ncbi:MAG: diguanylate cyclase [Firmicutes bacterium]|nr:diguanylate cyclase [Bacillota bacterium]
MKQMESEYRILLENLPDAFCYCKAITDNDGKPVDCIFLNISDAFAEMVGLSRHDIIGRRVTEVYPEIRGSYYNWLGLFDRVACTSEKISFEKYLELKDRWYEITAYSNEPGFLAILFRNIADARKIEQALQESEARYRKLVENLNEVIYILDEDARIVYISPNVEQLSGYTIPELTGRHFTEFVHADDQEGRIEQFFKVLSGVNEATEYRFLIKNGEATWVRTSARPITKEGRAIGIQGVLMDITVRKQAEKKMQHLSLHDSLTGLYNRYFLQNEMEKLDANKMQLPISIIMADLNGLKLINDTCGHDLGDEALRRTAELLKKSCRKKDLIARWGGDEFIILLPQTMLKEAKDVCKRITDYCKETHKEGLPISIALGVGLKNSTEKNLAEVLKDAEDSMYTHKLAEYQSARNAVLKHLLETLAGKRFETETHIERMQNMAEKVGEKAGLPDSERRRLAALVSLHDIGKINIPEEIIAKREELSAEEKEIMQKHSEIGCRIARATEVYAHIAEDILAHHEHWDGSGYPWGLKGEEIPFLARIVNLVDAYEVMTGGRPYRKAISSADALAELKRCAGTQFDPELVEVFVSLWEDSPDL